MQNNHSKFIQGTVLLLALLLSACGGGGGGSASGKMTTTVGAAGGTVAGPSGMSIEIPAGALDGDIEIGVRVSATGAPELPAGVDPATTVYEFTPHGILFKQPVTISIPSTDDPAVKPVLRAEQGDADWSTVNATLSGGRVSWQVMGFSWYSQIYACQVPNPNDPNSDPYACVFPTSKPILTAQPVAALTQIDAGPTIYHYRLDEEATISMTFRYKVRADCTGSPRAKIVHMRQDVLGANGQMIETIELEQVAPLTTIPNDTQLLTGEVTLPNVGFSYSDRALHIFSMQMECLRTFKNHSDGTGGYVFIDSRVMAAQASPAISQQPSDQTVTEPTAATFSAASGTVNTTVQWQRFDVASNTWVDISGATSPSYTIQATSVADNGAQFHAVFTNAYGSTPSNTAVLHVGVPSDHGRLFVTGRGEYGVRNDGLVLALGPTYTSAGEFTSPDVIAGVGAVRQIAVSGACLIALSNNDTVYTWGEGSGDLGNCLGQNTTTVITTPTAVAGLGPISEIAVGDSGLGYVLALGKNGKVYAWGFNSYGELGDGTTTHRDTPVEVATLTDVTHIWTGGDSSYALKIDGTLWSWGDNSWGQLGDGTKISSSVPVQVTGIPGSIIAVAAAGTYADVLTSDGTVFSLGFWEHGLTYVAVPGANASITQATGLPATLTHLVAGTSYTLALLQDGSLLAWGANFGGETGRTPTPGISQTPLAVPGVTNATSISAVEASSAAMRSDGQVMRWGARLVNASGTNTWVGESTPYEVTGFDLIP